MPTANRGPGRPPAANAAETRRRIVAAARQVFSELGYGATTFQEIAVRADLTRPAINHYFKTKRLLYREVVDRTNETVVGCNWEKALHEQTFLAQLDGFIDAAVGVDSEDRSAAAFLVASVLESQRHPELRREEHDGLRGTREFLTSAVNGAIERGELVSDVTVGPLVEMLIALFWGMGVYAGFVGSNGELHTVIEQFKKLLVGELWKLNE